jgi:hypothetical protein
MQASKLLIYCPSYMSEGDKPAFQHVSLQSFDPNVSQWAGPRERLETRVEMSGFEALK